MFLSLLFRDGSWRCSGPVETSCVKLGQTNKLGAEWFHAQTAQLTYWTSGSFKSNMFPQFRLTSLHLLRFFHSDSSGFSESIRSHASVPEQGRRKPIGGPKAPYGPQTEMTTNSFLFISMTEN